MPGVARDLMATTAVGAVSHTVMTWADAGFSPGREAVASTLALFLAGATAALLRPPA